MQICLLWPLGIHQKLSKLIDTFTARTPRIPDRPSSILRGMQYKRSVQMRSCNTMQGTLRRDGSILERLSSPYHRGRYSDIRARTLRYSHSACDRPLEMTLFRFSVRSALIAALWSGQISSAAHTRSMTLSGSESVERNHTLSSMLKCAKEWSSYDSLISANIFTGRETKTYHREKQTTLTYGTGKVYTSSAGIPVAHGTFTSTSFVVTVVTVTKTSTNWPLRTTGTARTQKTPTCSSLLWPDCSRLYSSYISSLGLPWNATVPSIDPPPFNSPACSIYNYQPWTSCHYSTEVDPGCSVSADNVQLFYFEPTTSKAHASVTDIVVHTFAPGTTFSSPSIYLLFNNLTAAAAYYGVDRYCTTCAYGNCVTSELVGAAAMATIGTMVDSTMLGMAHIHALDTG